MRAKDILIEEMQKVFGSDEKRIDHALKVLEYAVSIMKEEEGDELVVIAAAILHDIGIREAERKYGSSAGKYQEMEGPPIAKEIIDRTSASTGISVEQAEHVCRIVGNHHSARDIDTPEFRIIWDSDWIVNIPDEHPDKSGEELKKFIRGVFKTNAGRQIALKVYC